MKKNIHGNRYHAVASDGAIDPDHPLSRRRIAWWLTPPGVPAAGSRLVDLCGKYHGTLTGMAQSATSGWQPNNRPGAVEKYLAFDGIDDEVPTPIIPIVGDVVLTVAAWIYPTSVTAPYGVISWGSFASSLTGCGLCIGVAAGSSGFSPGSGNVSLEFAGGNGGRTGTGAVAVNAWFRIVIAKTAGVISATTNIYVNGTPVALGTSSAGTPNVASAVGSIGRLTTPGTNFFPGRIDDIAIWSRALSAAEVAEDYRLSLQGYRTPDSPLRWMSTRTWFVPATGGFNAAWAKNTNRLIKGVA